MAARPAFSCFLDYRRRPVREFDSMNGAITQMSALPTDRGITASGAALCASILGGSSLFGRVGVGWLLDRFFGARVAFVISLSTASGILLFARANNFPAGCLGPR